MVLSPSVFDRDVLALDIAGLLQAAAECPQTFHKHFRGCGAEEPDDRQSRGLLRTRRERRRGGTAEHRDKLPPPHGSSLAGEFYHWRLGCAAQQTIHLKCRDGSKADIAPC